MADERERSASDDETVVLASTSSDAGGAAVGSGVGRYVVLEEVGRGAMGRVLRAYDPKLQREVALKQVRGDVLGSEGAERLVAEARAMAKLSHPNVVAVYDVEETGDDSTSPLLLVMQYVAGQTLGSWVKATSRSWRAIIQAFCAAGRGLAAAHAAGLLHRDFKPANVLVGDDGVVRVTDFGLAKVDATTVASSTDGEPTSDTLTTTGTVMGTPRYMAPEQHEGEPLTAAADQYSFCLALWEALCGMPPFSGSDLVANKRRGPNAWPGTAVPGPVVQALRRGLHPDASARWPSMEALLDALAHDPAKRRARAMSVLGGVGALALAAVGWRAWATARADRCTEADARAKLAGAWDDARRAHVQAAVLGTEASYAPRAWERTAEALDDYAAAFVTMHVEACEATTVRGAQSAAVLDLRMACLHRARVDLAAVTGVLAEADLAAVQRAHDLTAGLRPLSRCADVEALEADVEPPLPDEAPTVEAMREHLAVANAAHDAGHYDEAEAALDAARASLDGIDYGPAHTEVALAEGRLFDAMGRYAEAEATLRRGLETAARWRQHREMSDAAGQLLFGVGYRQQRIEEGLAYRDLAMGLAQGDARREASAHNNLAVVLQAHGKHTEAEAEFRRALALWESTVGPDHLDVANANNNLVGNLHAQGKYAEAEVAARRSLALRETALGPDHPDVALSHNNLAGILIAQGEHTEAEAEFRRALTLREATLGSEHPDVGASRHNLATVLRAQGKTAEAEAEHRRALELWENTLGPAHPHVALARSSLTDVLRAQGKDTEAEAEHRRALALLDAAVDPDHPHLATSRSALAELLLDRGRLDEAHELAELAWRRHQEDDIAATARASTAFVLARTTWARGDQARARELAERALKDFAEDETQAAAVRTWLDDHPPR
jgi:tetratricopeptide (TPR) repeat protein/tRNA A-37 threonylcarbamoyl transferase component Bud32